MLELFFSAIIVTFTNFLVWKELLNKAIDFKNYKSYVGIIFMILILMLNSMFVAPLLKFIVILFMILITVKYVYSISVKEAIVLAVINQLVCIVGEILSIILVSATMNIKTNIVLVNTFFGTIYANVTMCLATYIIIQIPIIKIAYDKIYKLIQKKKTYNILVHIIIILSMASALFNFIYYDNNIILFSGACLVLLVIYVYFVINDIVIKNNYLNIHMKYNNSLETLKSYEEIMDKYKVSNHENKNQLLMIRNMLKKDTKGDVSKYIDKIVENEYKDDEYLMMETSKIPSGGLRAIVYSKLLYMKNNKINFDLKVDRKIRNVEFSDLEQDLILDICKIIGVFLDNAIEAVKGIKDGGVSIELYMLEEKFNISIANNFEGGIELDRIDEEKYTTKGEGHGYGLSLVKNIINKNVKLKNTRMINDNVFVQILKIDV